MASVNVDAALLRQGGVLKAEEKMVELSNGCICCTLREDLLASLSSLAAEHRFDHVRISPPTCPPLALASAPPLSSRSLPREALPPHQAACAGPVEADATEVGATDAAATEADAADAAATEADATEADATGVDAAEADATDADAAEADATEADATEADVGAAVLHFAVLCTIEIHTSTVAALGTEELRKAALPDELWTMAKAHRRPCGVARRRAPEELSHAVLLLRNPYYPLTLVPEEPGVESCRGPNQGGPDQGCCGDDTTPSQEDSTPPEEPTADVPIVHAPSTAPEGRSRHPTW